MAKLKTIIAPGDIYFITITVVNRLKIFTDVKYCQIIIDNLEFYRKKYQFKLFGFVIMPDHLHLLILPKFNEMVGSEEPTSTFSSLTLVEAGSSEPAIDFSKPTKPLNVSSRVGSEEPTSTLSPTIFVEAGSSEPARQTNVDGGFSKPTNIPTISDIIRDFKKYTATQIIRQLKADNSKDNLLIFHNYAIKHHPNKNRHYQIWLDRFWSTNIYSDKYFNQKLNYIHNNPVRAGLVQDLADYPWSSYQNYCLENNLLMEIDYFEG